MLIRNILAFSVLLFSLESRSVEFSESEEADKNSPTMAHAPSFLGGFPDEIWLKIFTSLDGADFKKMRQVCKGFKQLSYDVNLLPPKDDDKYLQMVTQNPPQESLILMSRIEPNIICDRNEALSQKIFSTKMPEDDPTFLSSWKSYVIFSLFNKILGSDKLFNSVQEIVELARFRFDDFDIIFKSLPYEKQIIKRNALMKQIACINESDRKILIDAYLNESDPYIQKDEKEYNSWKNYDGFLKRLGF